MGWIGLGAIGLPMSIRAATAGWEICGFDSSPDRRDAAGLAGVRIVSEPAAVGRQADELVVCVVRSADQVREVLLGEGGALAGTTGRIGVVMSSVGAEAMGALADDSAAHGVPLVDAPILGSPAKAAAGELTIVTSGDARARERSRPLLDDLASVVVELGDRPGSAQALKVVSQLLQVVGMVATFEGVALAVGNGLREEDVLEVIDATEPSWTTANWEYAKDLWTRGDPATSLGLFAKDLAAAAADGRRVGQDLPLTAEALRQICARLEGNRNL